MQWGRGSEAEEGLLTIPAFLWSDRAIRMYLAHSIRETSLLEAIHPIAEPRMIPAIIIIPLPQGAGG